MASQMTAQKLFLGAPVGLKAQRARANCNTQVVCSSGKKTDLNKQGLNSIGNDIVRENLKGTSRFMNKKGWVDPQGRKGKGYGVYKFADKYGANVDGYSPIYTPDIWSDSGNEYSLGTKGLIAWLGLLVVVLGVGVNLVISTSQLGS